MIKVKHTPKSIAHIYKSRQRPGIRPWAVYVRGSRTDIVVLCALALVAGILMAQPNSTQWIGVAGTVVNLAAIPLIGIFVQAGLLTGLLGLIPLADNWLAWVSRQITVFSGLLHVGSPAGNTFRFSHLEICPASEGTAGDPSRRSFCYCIHCRGLDRRMKGFSR